MDKFPEFLNERQAAKFLGVHPTTLMRWRQDGLGPPHYEYPGTRVPPF